MVSLLPSTLSMLGALLFYKAVRLLHFVRLARKTTLPYVITPLLETEVLALHLNPLLRYLYRGYLDRGKGWPRWCRFFIKDWAWEDKRQAHDRFGDVFLCVSPEGIICYSADAMMGWDVMNRRNVFTKPRDKYSTIPDTLPPPLFALLCLPTPVYFPQLPPPPFKFPLPCLLIEPFLNRFDVEILEPYGMNVATAEGKTYQFHVRITAPPFGDISGVNSLVWKETIHQTKLLTKAWAKSPPTEIQRDANALTLAVISLAGFGKQLEWSKEDDNQTIPVGYQLTFLHALQDTLHHMVPILLYPRWVLRIIHLEAALAHSQLDRYLRDIIRDQEAKLTANINHDDKKSRGNLLTAVVRSSVMFNSEQHSSKASGKSGERKQGFTEDETMGNLFIYLLAGYETTANAIIYGLAALALYQDIQERVIEEIDNAHSRAKSADRDTLTYEDDFEFLEYTYGFMYETFRLFPGVTLVTKMVHQSERIITDGPDGTLKTYDLPGGTRVYLNAPAVHYHPKYWPEPYKVDPNRWRSSPGGKYVVPSDKTRQMKGTLLTFSDGSRACLGRKFAQAEYIAFFATLLREYRVRLGPGSDRTSVERDMFRKSAGTITLAPLGNVRLQLQAR
ncbi:unnamed protein product [Penicillium pancosmium]